MVESVVGQFVARPRPVGPEVAQVGTHGLRATIDELLGNIELVK